MTMHIRRMGRVSWVRRISTIVVVVVWRSLRSWKWWWWTPMIMPSIIGMMVLMGIRRSPVGRRRSSISSMRIWV